MINVHCKIYDKSLWILLVCTLIAVGCKPNETPHLPKWIQEEKAYIPKSDSGNAFDAYVFAALEAENKAKNYIKRVNFTPGIKRKIMNLLSPACEKIRHAHNKKFEFKFVPTPQEESSTYQLGWSLLGKTLVWNIEFAIFQNNYQEAVSYFLLGTKFGVNLLKGGAIDASLGFTIIDACRVAIKPAMVSLNNNQLEIIFKELYAMLQTDISIQNALKNEYQNMLLSVQHLQDAFENDNYQYLQPILGSDYKDPVQFLRKLKKKSYETRVKYFHSLMEEGSVIYEKLSQDSLLPLTKREPWKPLPKRNRPWKRFSKHFFSGIKSILNVYDRTLARTRMLAINAFILKSIKEKGVSPKNLDSLADVIRIDPYSGKDFIYHADGADYVLYSVGENGKDNGGVSNDIGTSPDLILEP